MEFYNDLLKLNQLVTENEQNITGIIGNLLVFDTRNDNFHSLNNKFNDGFILVSRLQETGGTSKVDQENIVELHRTKIYDNDISDSTKLCICQGLNASMNKNCLIGLLKQYNKYIGADLNENSDECVEDIIVFKIKFKYIILESKLTPLPFNDIREIIYFLTINEIKINSKIIFFVKETVLTECAKRDSTLYIALEPKKNEGSRFNIYTMYTPMGYLQTQSVGSSNKISINNFFSNRELYSNDLENDYYNAISRFDIYSESNYFELRKETENPNSENYTFLHDRLTRSKCINSYPGTCLSLFVRWNFNHNENFYPNLPKIKPSTIIDSLFFLKMDPNQIRDSALISIIENINNLEWLLDSDFNYIYNKAEPNLMNINSESENLQIEVLKFIKKLSLIWEYSIIDKVQLNKNEQNIEYGFENESLDFKESNIRLNMDYTDFIWNFISQIRNIEAICKIVALLLDELEKSCKQNYYEQRFIPQVRNDNTTIFSTLVRTAIEIFRNNQYLEQRYGNSVEIENSNMKVFNEWELIRKKYFGPEVLKYVLIEIGFECITSDIKMMIKSCDPLIGDSSFDWYLNHPYNNLKKQLEDLNLEHLYKSNRLLLDRLKKLIPVCYISKLLKNHKCSWDISKKLIQFSLKYYSCPETREAQPTIFITPIFNKTVVNQLVSSLIPNQVEISFPENDGGSINLNKVESIELPNLDSELNEAVVKFNNLPICIWRIFTDIEGSNQLSNHYTIQIVKNITSYK
ncbi:hypothetical protein HWI79_1070 [Cryptosporidium felis]|nr:hypothetical protein HWI79_1070 [Cryptosporidium felis]